MSKTPRWTKTETGLVHHDPLAAVRHEVKHQPEGHWTYTQDVVSSRSGEVLHRQSWAGNTRAEVMVHANAAVDAEEEAYREDTSTVMSPTRTR